MDLLDLWAAQLEYDERMRSFDSKPIRSQELFTLRSGWVSRGAGRLLYATGDKLVSLGEWMKHQQHDSDHAPAWNMQRAHSKQK